MRNGGRFLAQRNHKKPAWTKILGAVLLVTLLLVALTAGFVYSKMSKIRKAQDGPNQLTNDVLAGLLAEDPTGSYADDFETEIPNCG